MEHQKVHPLIPFDKDGKEFKAHRRVLSEASPFFEQLLESDMKENKEEVILNEENAKELIIAGNYLFLPKLKAIAGRFLERSLTTSNCISTYYFAETYRSEELAARAKTFIQSNFATVAKSEEFLNLTSQEVEEWISSDEIVINAEEDVFNIILGWIEKERETRKGKFEELFRHVRLIFASRDFLVKELVTNDLVQGNESCMNRVTQAMNWNDRSTYYHPPSPQLPRKIFQSDFLVAYKWHGDRTSEQECYVYNEDHWYEFPESNLKIHRKVTSCDGKLYAISDDLSGAERYEPLCEDWVSLEWADGSTMLELDKYLDSYMLFEYGVSSILWANGEMFAVVSDMLLQHQPKFLKYNLESHSWKSLPFSFLVGKLGVCAVAFNKYIYVVGGWEEYFPPQIELRSLNDAARFDTVSNKWEEIAAMQEARSYAFGSAANEKVYIAGGLANVYIRLRSCEVYNEMTNEWCFIASLKVPRSHGSMAIVANIERYLGAVIQATPSYTFSKRLKTWTSQQNIVKFYIALSIMK
ncbi:hypothetical protein ACROYT_G016227 [Oculina patagonica]